jgi:Tetratricopeptide repeat
MVRRRVRASTFQARVGLRDVAFQLAVARARGGGKVRRPHNQLRNIMPEEPEILYQARGESARARPILERVVELHRKITGGEHPAYLHAVQDLAWLCEKSGDLERSAVLQREAGELETRLKERGVATE